MPSSAKVDLAAWQLTLDYLLPRKPTLRPDELAQAVGVDQRTIARAFEGPAGADGKILRPWLLGFSLNAGRGERFTRRIPRDCAILWLAHCANYTPEDRLNLFLEAIDAFPARDLAVLHARIGAKLRQ